MKDKAARWQTVRVLLVFLPGLTLMAADPPAPASAPPASPNMQSSLALQQKSIEIQRQAIRSRLGPTGASTGSFFTVPWISTAIAPATPVATPTADCDPVPESQISSLIDAAAKREGVQPALVRAVIRQESGFHACAVSPKGAQGLMQLMPATSERFHVTDPFDPAQNVDAGTKFLKELLARYAGDLKLALGAYNAGPARVDGAGEVPDVAETKDYVSNILNDLGKNGGSGGTPEPGPSGTT
ncbi:MAG TPA: lytic transglycosylase domain-containing protein [Bryobacteraceae bacterium]|nr:lytic transglycosylase domain-containing protein [Bryobacteraceae bacterium]